MYRQNGKREFQNDYLEYVTGNNYYNLMHLYVSVSDHSNEEDDLRRTGISDKLSMVKNDTKNNNTNNNTTTLVFGNAAPLSNILPR